MIKKLNAFDSKKQDDNIIFSKIINPIQVVEFTNNGKEIYVDLFCKITIKERFDVIDYRTPLISKEEAIKDNISFKALSISGVAGPTSDGNAKGSSGQCLDYLITPGFKLKPGWDIEMVAKFYNVWKSYHLNDMTSYCSHQEQAGIVTRSKEPQTPFNCCQQCGYYFGSKWLGKPLADDIIQFLTNLPDTQVQPAWV